MSPHHPAPPPQLSRCILGGASQAWARAPHTWSHPAPQAASAASCLPIKPSGHLKMVMPKGRGPLSLAQQLPLRALISLRICILQVPMLRSSKLAGAVGMTFSVHLASSSSVGGRERKHLRAHEPLLPSSDSRPSFPASCGPQESGKIRQASDGLEATVGHSSASPGQLAPRSGKCRCPFLSLQMPPGPSSWPTWTLKPPQSPSRVWFPLAPTSSDCVPSMTWEKASSAGTQKGE